MPTLEIYRFELVFMNPEEARWQMFQEARPEHQLDGTAVYRHQAQGLLSFVRECFKTYASQPDALFEVPDLPDGTKKISLNIKKLRDRLSEIGDEDERAAWLDEVNTRLIRTLKSEGLEQATKAANDIFKALRGARANPIFIERKRALALVTALYCSRRWDVFGRLAFPSPEREALSMPQVFCYAVNYSGFPKSADKPQNDSARTRAERALGYSVTVEFKGGKLCSEEQNYFGEFCDDVADEREAFWYCFYGFLLDAINTEIAGNNATDPPSGPVQIVCFPLRICGYDHFLQLYVRQHDGEPPVALGEVQTLAKRAFAAEYSQSSVHTPVLLKECLRELLVQMHIAAFQHFAELDLKQEPRAPKNDEIFCKHAPNLVRLDQMLTSKGLYRYARPNGDLAFERWRCKNLSEDECSRTLRQFEQECEHHLARIGPLAAIVPWEDKYRGYLEPLFKGTGQQRLEEQYEWLNRRISLHKSLQNAQAKLRKAAES